VLQGDLILCWFYRFILVLWTSVLVWEVGYNGVADDLFHKVLDRSF
jgi:hypothetical protein